MLSKESFKKFINNYQEFEEAFDRIEEALLGRKYASNLYESDWYEAVGGMLDSFLESHFTEDGADLVSWWLFEDVDKVIYEKPQQLDFFDEFKEGEDKVVPVKTIDELWNYMEKNKEYYLL